MSTSARPADLEVVDSHSESRHINRELSWLAFNERVLAEADNLRHPLLERLRFLSISASNLDEFYMVRVAGLKGQHLAGIKTLSQDGLTPAQQLEAIRRRAGKLMADQQVAWLSLRRQLDESGMSVIEPGDLEPRDRAWLEDRFMAEVFPVLTPLALDPAHPFPFVANRGFGLALELERVNDGVRLQALTLIPPSIDQFVRLPRSPDPVPPDRTDDRNVSRSSLPWFRRRLAGRVQAAARQRSGNRGGGGGSCPPLRDGAQAPAPRSRNPSGGRRDDAGRPSSIPDGKARCRPGRHLCHRRNSWAQRHRRANRRRAARSRLHSLQCTVSRAYPRF